MATPQPPISPTVATPLAHRKRRHSSINGSQHLAKAAKSSDDLRREDSKTSSPTKSRLSLQQGPKAAGSSDGLQRGDSKTSSPMKSRLQAPPAGQRSRSETTVRPSPTKARLQPPPAGQRSESGTPGQRERSATPSRFDLTPRGERPAGLQSRAPSVGSSPNKGLSVSRAGQGARSSTPSNGAGPANLRTQAQIARSSTPVKPERSGTPSSAGKTASRLTGGASAGAGASARSTVSSQGRTTPTRCTDDDDKEESEGSEVGKSDIEDILDSAELDPYDSITDEDGASNLDTETAGSLKQRLLRVGPQAFLEETLTKAQMPPQILGTAFGLDPSLLEEFGEEVFLRILGQIVIRTYFKRQKLPQYNNLDDVASLLNKCSNIMVITGAGISTSLDIPDFRSMETGFYARAAQKAASKGYTLTDPTDVFNLQEFDNDPGLFYLLAGDLLPKENRFSPTHAFLKLLQDKGKLLTCYTQNIDNLEESAGISKDKLIQCHGSFATATCRRKRRDPIDGKMKMQAVHKVPGSEIFPDIRKGEPAQCKACIAELAAEAAQKAKGKRAPPKKKRPGKNLDDDDDNLDDNIPQPGVMKPDITFFGEALSNTFFDRFTEQDCKRTDLVLVLGTSLKVAPVSEMPNYLPHDVPHVYVSRESIRHVEFDVQCLGNCDDVVVELVRRAGWAGGAEGEGVVGHEMVVREDGKGKVIVVEAAEGEGGEGVASKWSVRRVEV